MRGGLAGAIAALLASSAALAQAAPDPIANGFRDPPSSARPRVWWHWLNGNITEDGIDKDLAWMKRIGIGGVQNFDASLMTPQVVDKRLAYMTPEWKRAFAHAVTTADRLGLEFAIAASPGWSETGGPWVKPEDGMKKLVWSQFDIAGGKRFRGTLPPLPTTTGPYQDAPFNDALAGDAPAKPPQFGGSVAVLAIPLPASPAGKVAATTSDGRSVDAATLDDASLVSAIDLPRGTAAAPGQITLRYPAARTVRAATVFLGGALPPFGDPEYAPKVEVEIDGRWQTVAQIALANVPTTVTFAPVRATAARLTLSPNTLAKRPGLGEPAPGAQVVNVFPPAAGGAVLRLGTFSVTGEPRIERVEAKAGFATTLDYYAVDTREDTQGVDPRTVVDLTARVGADGTLDWTPPRGRWRILRLGYSLLGTTNHPATAEATGLEVDKYDAAAVRRYMETYLANYRDAAGLDAMGRSVGALLTDSIETGDSNWTPGMVTAFKQRRGYDPTPWLPALTGMVIGSTAKTDAFLYDYRHTLADLIASEHYGTVAAVAHQNGLKVYGEALEDMRPLLGDDMAMRAHTDIPMAAMWTYGKAGPRSTLIGDDRGAASVAHIYGQNLAAAESLTSAFAPWAFAPADLRPIIDLEFAHGINRPIIHTSVHQPIDKAPGLSLAIFGQYFNRHESWAEMAKPWVDYIARTSFLLQQGRNVADVAYFYGEEAPITALNAYKPIDDVPPSYGWDYINADALRDAVTVENGEIVAKGGARYRVLYLGGTSRRMTLPTLRRIATLLEAGATVIGKPPERSPSLADDPAAFDALVARLWPDGGDARIGAGRVIAADSAAAGLSAAAVAPDFRYTAAPGAEVVFVHRRVADGDIYWVDNRQPRAEPTEMRFRTTGKVPELWQADTGRTEPLSYRVEGDETVVPLAFEAKQSAFVVFRKPAAGATGATVAARVERPLATLSGPWMVRFQPGRGAPAATTMAVLQPFERNADAEIRYFSGVATYTSRFTLPRGVARGAPLWLDLGQVGDVAEVRVNGTSVGSAWHAPYRLDIAGAARRGTNTVEVRVANLWVNRLIGDVQPGAVKVSFTAGPTYLPEAPLRPSGLIGPVTLSTDR